MANYIRRIEQCQQLASDAGIAWTDAQLVQRAQTVMGKCGLFRDEYKEWVRRPRAEKSWVDFKRYWQQRYAEYEHLSKLTAAESGFEANLIHNNGNETGGTTNNQLDRKIDDAMDNLAALMSSDKGQLETLTATNAALTAQVAELTATNARLAKEITTLTGIITTMSRGAATARTTANKHAETDCDPNGCCWSHGYRVHYNHNSATC